ncbi:hypothetical protein GCM10007036_31090 [Alsobacter metallidurans]|uniref:Uncharacterized protein n=1 Tax=Alsobacter metallidurans TaxID=340221 RepID=A0A917MJ41_9HYPH|nr:hypothetical protein [Alsobacter metallidurans]GGH24583.1 hypothetical protein GCM10007036_31090 [Alsobacter metallidurans]
MRMIEGRLRELEAAQRKRFGSRIEQMTDVELNAEIQKFYAKIFPTLAEIERSSGAGWKDYVRAWWLHGLADENSPDFQSVSGAFDKILTAYEAQRESEVGQSEFCHSIKRGG